MGDYWLRHVRPIYTQKFVEGIDTGVNSLFKTYVGIDTDSWTDFLKEIMRLPIISKGCGLKEAVDHRHGQFVGAMLHSTMPLIDRTEKDNCAIEGRLNIPAISPTSLVKDYLTTLSRSLGKTY